MNSNISVNKYSQTHYYAQKFSSSLNNFFCITIEKERKKWTTEVSKNQKCNNFDFPKLNTP